jgi:hypothetical protein
MRTFGGLGLTASGDVTVAADAARERGNVGGTDGTTPLVTGLPTHDKRNDDARTYVWKNYVRRRQKCTLPYLPMALYHAQTQK